MTIQTDFQQEAEGAVAFLREQLNDLRTGRAHPGLLLHIMVEAYDPPTILPLNQLGTINVSDARSLVVLPWDKTIIKNIEKAITGANLGLNTSSEGGVIRVILPELTEERRREYVKILGKKLEEARVKVRGMRDKFREHIIKLEREEKTIGEDEKFRLLKELDAIAKEQSEEIDAIGKHKEEEIMEV